MVANVKQTMRYHVVTHYGTSEQYYGDSNPYKVHGSGQGAGNSGMEWNFLSIPIMEMMKKKRRDVSSQASMAKHGKKI